MNNKIVLITSIFVSLSIISFYLYQQNYLKNNNKQLVDTIVTIFQKYVLTYDIDKQSINPEETVVSQAYPLDEYQTLSKKLMHYVEQKKPIILTMVGFPYKSANIKDKVISSDADAAERYSLVFLQNFLNEVKTIYKNGIQLIIFTDGIVFCDIEKVSDDTVLSYENALKILTQDLPDIKICTMHDLYSLSPAEIRNNIATMNPSWNTFQDMVKTDTKLQEDIAILAQRLAFELALSSLTEKEITDIATQETHRGMQYSNFLKKFRAEETITCSVHYQKHLDRKIGLKLSDSCITPWHGVLVETNGIFSIKHLEDVDQSQYKQMHYYCNGLPLTHLKHQ
ncbi:MAG TPA: L-tyrosine/L-tryptophan isonitrile synthase family protein [Candidatus Babeliales bacterium]|nr:L-tyrosine/L-tryptophan isonitrile synthase family protein [Candidatus Babeliales bacterium]